MKTLIFLLLLVPGLVHASCQTITIVPHDYTPKVVHVGDEDHSLVGNVKVRAMASFDDKTCKISVGWKEVEVYVRKHNPDPCELQRALDHAEVYSAALTLAIDVISQGVGKGLTPFEATGRFLDLTSDAQKAVATSHEFSCRKQAHTT